MSDDETLTNAQMLAEGTALAEWILSKLIDHKLDEPGYVLQMGLVLAMLAHGEAMAKNDYSPGMVMRFAITPEGMQRSKELSEWFLERMNEHFADAGVADEPT